MDLILKSRDMTKEAREGLTNLRKSGINITDLLNEILSNFKNLDTISHNKVA